MSRLAVAALVVSLVACHDDAKPTAVPLPETSASSVGSVSAVSPALTPPIAPAELVIEADRITVRGTKVVDLPADRTLGVDPKDKRSGKNDLYIVPLAAVYAPDAGRTHDGAITIDVDDTTPYRLLIEVLFTLGQSELGRWELRRRGHAEALPLSAPRYDATTALHTSPLTIIVQPEGVALKLNGTNVGTRCALVGGGLAVPKRDDKHDTAALDACLRAMKPPGQPNDAVVVTANPAVPFAEVWVVLAVVRGEKGDLFPNIQLGVSR